MKNSLYCRLLSRFNDMRLIKKFYLLFFIAWIIPMMISSYYIYHRFTENLINSQIELALKSHRQIESFLSYRLNQIYQTSQIIAMDKEINSILKKSRTGYSDVEQLKDLSALRLTIERFHDPRKEIDELRLYVPGGRIYSNENKMIFNMDSVRDTLWCKKAFYGWGWCTPCPPELMDKPGVVSIVRPIRDLEKYYNMIGLVRTDISLDEIKKLFSRANVTSGCLTYLVTEDGMLVASSPGELLNEYKLSECKLKQVSAENNAFSFVEQQGTKSWAYASNLLPVNWYLVTILPKRELYSGIKTVQWQFLITTLLFFFVAILATILVINSVTNRLGLLVDHMHMVQKGDLSAGLKSKSHDEVGQLVENFNYMLDRIKVLLNQQYALGQELKSAELKALQSQINPHFLYNTLEMIRCLSEDGSTDEIKSVVRSMAKFYRLSLNRGNDVISIENELELVRNYMYIQNMRFHNRIQVIENIKDIQDYAIPKITLQPIVENAIIHGILEKATKSGLIKICGALNNDNMVEISITDDGVGMECEQLERLKKGDEVLNSGSSYGLNSIDERIRLFFNIEYGISIESQLNVGTRVTLCFPPVLISDIKNMRLNNRNQ